MVEHSLGILIVDDDPNDLDGLKETLSSLNLQLSTLQDPFQVVDQVKSQQPDLVLLDALLPGLSGFDLCKQIKTLPEGKDTIVLILTGVYLKDHYRREALNQFKADGFLTKPYRTKDLQRLVVRLLAKKLKITPKKLEETIGLTPDVLPHSEREKKPGWLGRFFGRWKGESAPSGFLHTVPTPPKHRRTAQEPFRAAVPVHESAVKSEKAAEARKGVPAKAETISRMEPEPELEPRLAVEVDDTTRAEAAETAAGTKAPEPESPEVSVREELADAGEEEPLSSSADVMTVIMPEPSSEAPDETREPEPVAEDAELEPPEPPEDVPLDEGIAEEEKAQPPPPSEPATEDAELEPPEPPEDVPLDEGIAEEEKAQPPPPPEPTTEDLVVGVAATPEGEPPEGEEEQAPQPVESTAEDVQEPVGPIPEEPLTTEPTERRDVVSAAEDVELTPPEGPSLDDELPDGEEEEYPPEPAPSTRSSETDESDSDTYILHPPEESELDIQAARSIFETIQDTLEDTQESIKKITGEEFEPKVEIITDEPTVEAKDQETTATVRTRAFVAKSEETTATVGTQAVEPEDEETTVTVRTRPEAESVQEPPSRSEVDAAPHLEGKPFPGLPIYEEEDFLFELKRQLMMCKRVGRSFTLILVRIADLGQIAELFGKEARAKVFLHVAEQSVAALREVDMVGLLRSQELIALTAFASERYGGDRIISRLKVTLKRNPFSVGENIPPFVPKLHFGMATHPIEVGSMEELLDRAKSDVAL